MSEAVPEGTDVMEMMLTQIPPLRTILPGQRDHQCPLHMQMQAWNLSKNFTAQYNTLQLPLKLPQSIFPWTPLESTARDLYCHSH